VFVGVHEKCRPRQIVVKIKCRQIHAPHIDDPSQNELIGQLAECLVETNNLLVEGRTFPSRLSAERQEYRLARSASDKSCLLIVDFPHG
jgi:hypothetical protein